jgi:hypothetical protein
VGRNEVLFEIRYEENSNACAIVHVEHSVQAFVVAIIGATDQVSLGGCYCNRYFKAQSVILF